MPEADPPDRNDPNDEVVPKLPRGRGMKLSTAEIFRIVMTAGLLVALVVLIKPCSKSVSTFVMGFGSGSGSAKRSGSGSAKVDPYEHLTPGMSDDEVRLAIERAKLKNLGAQPAVGPGSAGSAAAGSNAKPPAPGVGSAALGPAPVQMQRRELAPTAVPAAAPR
ncbi:hypothetical protein BH11MYX1_BH11MYX1_38660 [soil metagenome]